MGGCCFPVKKTRLGPPSPTATRYHEFRGSGLASESLRQLLLEAFVIVFIQFTPTQVPGPYGPKEPSTESPDRRRRLESRECANLRARCQAVVQEELGFSTEGYILRRLESRRKSTDLSMGWMMMGMTSSPRAVVVHLRAARGQRVAVPRT